MIEFDKLSKTKKDLLETCYRAIQFIDDDKVKPLKVDIEEDAAPIRQIIEIQECSISYNIKVNHINVMDDNIEW